MPKVSVIGAGDVGASIAYTLQLSGSATEIMLIDANRERAEGNVLDMNHGLFFTQPVKIGWGDFDDCVASDVIIITAGARQKEGESRLELTRRNKEILASIISSLKDHIGHAILMIITNPVDVMTKIALELSGLPSSRVFGSGTVLDSARFRYELSRRCEVDPRNVHAYVIGEHGDSEVFLWSQVRIGGVELEWFCPACGKGCHAEDRGPIEDTVRQSAYHVIETKGHTAYGVSLAVRRITDAILRNESSVLTVSTLIQGAYGIRDVCLSIPAVVNAKGVDHYIEGPLSEEEKERLVGSAEVIRSASEQLCAQA